jgi:hypothetical protein
MRGAASSPSTRRSPHPERLYGLVCIDAVGALPTVIPEFRENLLRRLSDADRARVEELAALSGRDEASVEELLELLQLL